MGEATSYSHAAQLERTVLAWNRTALAIAANGALIIHDEVARGLTTVAGPLVIAIGALLWIVSIRRYPTALGQRSTHVLTDSPRLVAGLACFVGALTVGELILAIAS